MTAGRELDALIAEKVMGWRSVDLGLGPLYYPPGLHPAMNVLGHTIPHYSTSIAAAWLVVETLNHFTLRRKGEMWTVEYRDCRNPMDHFVVDNCCASVTADTAPLAICLAALKAVGVGDAQ